MLKEQINKLVFITTTALNIERAGIYQNVPALVIYSHFNQKQFWQVHYTSPIQLFIFILHLIFAVFRLICASSKRSSACSFVK